MSHVNFVTPAILARAPAISKDTRRKSPKKDILCTDNMHRMSAHRQIDVIAPDSRSFHPTSEDRDTIHANKIRRIESVQPEPRSLTQTHAQPFSFKQDLDIVLESDGEDNPGNTWSDVASITSTNP